MVAADASLGTLIGNYRVIGVLGSGGMGDVYLGEHKFMKRPAAVKVLQPRYSVDKDIVERFFNEAKAATSINDPGIVQVFECDYHDGRPYIAMEALEGESLDARLRKKRRLGAQEALRLCRQVAKSLAAAHKKGVIHRDLKPANIFLVPDSEVSSGERSKILDFGIAKLLDDPSMTDAGRVMGTPPYMSPEQCEGRVEIDHRSDIYSLGCVLFHLLTGRPLFQRDGRLGILDAHIHSVAPAPSAFAPRLPISVDTLVLRCLAKAPADRFQTMDELAAEMKRLLAELPADEIIDEPAREAGLAPTLPLHELLRNDGPTAATAPVAGAGPLATIVDSATESPTLLVSPVAEPRRSTSRLRGTLAIALAVLACFAVIGWRLSAGSISPVHASTPAPRYDLVLAGSNTIGGIDAATHQGLARDLLIAFVRSRYPSPTFEERGISSSDVDDSDRELTFTPGDGTPQVRVLIQAHGSDTAVDALLRPQPADIGMSSHPQPKLTTRELKSVIIAFDAVGVFVHRNNPIQQLTLDQLRQIFGPPDSGNPITDWSSLVPTFHGSIHTYGRDTRSGTTEVFRERTAIDKLLVNLGRSAKASIPFTGPADAARDGYDDTQKVIDSIRNDPQAIGYFGRATNWPANTKAVSIASGDGSPASTPTPASTATKSYILSRELYFYYRASNPRPLVADFVKFCLSDAGQRVVSELGFVENRR